MVRNRKKILYFLKKNQHGQTAIEYILLIAVLMSFVFLVFDSELFKGQFGDDGRFSQAFSSKISCSYRYALGASNGRKCGTENLSYQNKQHPSYFPGGGATRFFGPKSNYPKR